MVGTDKSLRKTLKQKGEGGLSPKCSPVIICGRVSVKENTTERRERKTFIKKLLVYVPDFFSQKKKNTTETSKCSSTFVMGHKTTKYRLVLKPILVKYCQSSERSSLDSTFKIALQTHLSVTHFTAIAAVKITSSVPWSLRNTLLGSVCTWLKYEFPKCYALREAASSNLLEDVQIVN